MMPNVPKGARANADGGGLPTTGIRVSVEQAFGVLRWRSQETHVKLRALAKQLIAEISTLSPPSAEVQGAFDHLLLTVHERIPGESNA